MLRTNRKSLSHNHDFAILELSYFCLLKCQHHVGINVDDGCTLPARCTLFYCDAEQPLLGSALCTSSVALWLEGGLWGRLHWALSPSVVHLSFARDRREGSTWVWVSSPGSVSEGRSGWWWVWKFKVSVGGPAARLVSPHRSNCPPSQILHLRALGSAAASTEVTHTGPWMPLCPHFNTYFPHQAPFDLLQFEQATYSCQDLTLRVIPFVFKASFKLSLVLADNSITGFSFTTILPVLLII